MIFVGHSFGLRRRELEEASQAVSISVGSLQSNIGVLIALTRNLYLPLQKPKPPTKSSNFGFHVLS